MAESEKRRARRRGHEFQYHLPLLVAHLRQHLPEQFDSGVFFVVVAYHVQSAVQRVASQIRYVDVAGLSTDQSLQFGLVEHGQPRGLDDLAKTLQKRVGLQSGLGLETVPGNV